MSFSNLAILIAWLEFNVLYDLVLRLAPVFYRTQVMPMTHAPETGARKLASVSGASVIQSGAEFFWRQILESDRTCSISRQNVATT